MTTQEMKDARDYLISVKIDKEINGLLYACEHLVVALSALDALLNARECFPPRIPDEVMTIEPPCKDGRYYKILIDGMVVALIPSEKLAIDLVRRFFSVNARADEDIAVLACKMEARGVKNDILP